MKEQDLGRLSTFVSRAGRAPHCGDKIGSGSSEQTIERELTSIEGSVESSLTKELSREALGG